MKSLVLLGPNTRSTGKIELKFISNLPIPDSTIQTKSFKAKKIRISNEWWETFSETTGLSVEEIAKFLTKIERMKRKKTQKIWLDGCHLLFDVYRHLPKKKSVYILKLCLEHADNMFWRKSMIFLINNKTIFSLY